ncbi:MAG: hypothetical protein EA360_04630 [Balneolaceae bacterium]|nr:MAG: hypothetical protein EA360_04630 [Balneolaceae bacterium]
MKIYRFTTFLLFSTFVIGSFYSCSTPEKESVVSPEIMIPAFVTPNGESLFHENSVYVNDYSNTLHAIFIIAGNSRGSEYGHPNYRPELYPEFMNQRAEEWLDLMHITDRFFNDSGRFVNQYRRTEGEYAPAEFLDMSIYPHLVYSYHMHHRGDRFNDPVLFERLSRETTSFITMPGRFLLSERFSEGLFSHENGDVDHLSMSYGLAGIHGHGYAWIVWKKPDGADNMGLISEEMLDAWLDYSISDMLETYRSVAERLDDAWDEKRNTYNFGDGVIWATDAVGAVIRGKKVMYDALYMFGDESDRELALRVFDRTANMFETVTPLIRPWGLPEKIAFTEAGAEAASDNVNLYDWYQFLNHIGGGFSFDRERDGTSQFINRYREDLRPQFGQLADDALLGMMEYHLSDNGFVAFSVDYENGSILDDRISVSTAGMLVTVAGNLYTHGNAFARADGWNDTDSETAVRSRELYDLKFRHFELISSAIK